MINCLYKSCMEQDSKKALRTKISLKRSNLNFSEIREKSNVIMEKLLSLSQFQKAQVVAFYLSKSDEVQTENAIKKILEEKTILVPVTKNEIKLVKFTSFSDLEPALFSVPEPKTKRYSNQQPDVIVIPGLAFDKHGNRLGYGKGYYDTLLKNLKSIKVGVCFDFQLINNVPSYEHDQKVDTIITEKRILNV